MGGQRSRPRVSFAAPELNANQPAEPPVDRGAGPTPNTDMTQITLPHNLQNGPGRTADATQVMANYNTIVGVVNSGSLGTDNLANGGVTPQKRSAAVGSVFSDVNEFPVPHGDGVFTQTVSATFTGRPVLLVFNAPFYLSVVDLTIQYTVSFRRDTADLYSKAIGQTMAGTPLNMSLLHGDWAPPTGACTYSVRVQTFEIYGEPVPPTGTNTDGLLLAAVEL